MGYRLSKIYTKTGDDGTTGLGDGSRVRKDSLRVESYGEVDELNSVIGIVIASGVPAELVDMLTRIQHDLFNLGGELSVPGMVLLSEERVSDLEKHLDRLNADLAPLKDFILPGGDVGAAYCHLARTVCRRAERSVVKLSHSEQVSETVVRYLNRLSDLLFVMARSINRLTGHDDVLWDRTKAGG